MPMEVALRDGDERIWVKKFWSKLFVISESFESLIPMCFTRNGAVIMGENERNLCLILNKILKVPRRKKVFRECQAESESACLPELLFTM